MPLVVLRPADADTLLARAVGQAPTYPEIGGTAGLLPGGYGHLRRSAVLGHGRERFEEVARAVRSWQVQRLSGLQVHASSATTEPGATVVLVLGVRGRGVAIPCRVVRSVEEPDRAGFAYGSLPGHPETGEESFVAAVDASGEVTLEITAFSRPAWALARAGAPVNRLAQRVAVGRYLRSLG